MTTDIIQRHLSPAEVYAAIAAEPEYPQGISDALHERLRNLPKDEFTALIRHVVIMTKYGIQMRVQRMAELPHARGN